MWPRTPLDLQNEQTRLAARVVAEWSPPESALDAGGCFVCFSRGYSGTGERGEPAWSAAVRMKGRRIAEHALFDGRVGDPYMPGLLALREGPALEAAVRGLRQRPEIVIVNASGRDHPRRAGLALHLGAILDMPTIGVTHRPYEGQGEWPADESGAAAPLRRDGEIVGFWLRSRIHRRPVVVHAGWRTPPEVALEVARRCIQGARTPEPLRQARRFARLARAATRSSR